MTTEEAMACLQGKASVQCENIHMTETYLYPQDRGSSMKSFAP